MKPSPLVLRYPMIICRIHSCFLVSLKVLDNWLLQVCLSRTIDACYDIFDIQPKITTFVKLKAVFCFLGYSVELFGIQSNCAVIESILDKHFCTPLIVNVTPKLPLLQFQSAISAVKSFVNSSHRGSSLALDVTLHRGQRYRVCLFAVTTLKARYLRHACA